MKKILLSTFLVFSITSYSQVVVDGVDLNNEVQMFEVYLMQKPFSVKESIFANSGKNNFKLQNYDTKKQSIYNAEGKKFEKGQYLELYNYLISQGWESTDEHQVKLGNNTGRTIMFKKKKTE